MKHTNISSLIMAVILSGMLAGCATQADSKKTAAEQWEKTALPAKLSTVENLIERGQTAEARETLQKCLQVDPDLAAAHFMMGRVQVIENQSAEACASFEKTVALDATFDAAWYHLGVLSFLDGNTEQALDAYQKALALNPAKTEYITAIAQLYMKTDRIEQARLLLDEKLAQQPQDRDLLLCMAELTHRMGQLDKTTALYERVLRINAKDSQIIELLGYCYIAQKDWSNATRTFERLLEVVDEEARKESVLNTLALCALNANRYSQALSCYDKLSLLRRDDAEVWLNMAQAALGADLPKRASYSAQKALLLKPSWPQAYAVLGSAQYLQAEYDEALASFARVCDDSELGGFAWFMTGRTYARLGQTANADTAYKKAGDRGTDSLLISRFLKTKTDAM